MGPQSRHAIPTPRLPFVSRALPGSVPVVKWPEPYERFLPGWKELNPVTRADAEDGFRRRLHKYLRSHQGLRKRG